MPPSMCRLLHRAVHQFTHPGHGDRQTGRHTLRAARCGPPLPHLRPGRAPSRLLVASPFSRDVRRHARARDRVAPDDGASHLPFYTCQGIGRRRTVATPAGQKLTHPDNEKLNQDCQVAPPRAANSNCPDGFLSVVWSRPKESNAKNRTPFSARSEGLRLHKCAVHRKNKCWCNPLIGAAVASTLKETAMDFLLSLLCFPRWGSYG